MLSNLIDRLLRRRREAPFMPPRPDRAPDAGEVLPPYGGRADARRRAEDTAAVGGKDGVAGGYMGAGTIGKEGGGAGAGGV